MTDISEKLVTLRKEHGLSQDELAEKLLVTRQAVSKWERGEALPDTDNLIAIAKLYNISLDELVGLREQVAEPAAPKEENPTLSQILLSTIPYPLITLILFFIIGHFHSYAVSWIIFLTVPIFYSTIDAIKKRQFATFSYPVLVTMVFMFIGMEFKIWHPTWVVFLTIPIFYAIFTPIDNYNAKKREKNK